MAQDQPRGYVNATLHKSGLSLALHALHGTHPKHKQKVELAWR